jgi:hypothetical protein
MSPEPQLIKALVDNEFFGRPALVSLVGCLQTTHPAVSRADIAKISAIHTFSPEGLDWSEVNALIAGLTELGILSGDHVFSNNQTFWVADKNLMKRSGLTFSTLNLNPSFLVPRERLRLKLLESLGEWLRLNCLVSTNGSRVATANEPLVTFRSLSFDFLGFSYIRGVAARPREDRPTPSPVVGDCLVGDCGDHYARSFVERVKQCSARAAHPPLGFILARRFTPGAFGLLRTEGLLPWTHSQLLGEKLARGIERIIEITDGLARKAEFDPAAFAEAFEGLDTLKSLFGNVKGDLFTLIVGYVFQRRGYVTRLGWAISNDDGEQFEVDVSAILNNEALIIECKGIEEGKLVEDDEVRKHFVRRTPLARQVLRDNRELRIERISSLVITTGAFEPKTLDAVMAGAIKGRADTVLEIWDRPRLIRELRHDGHFQLVQIINRYYGSK